MAEDLPAAEALQTLADIGWLPGTPAKALLGEADADPEHEPNRPRGVEVWQNPFAALRDDRQLWRVWDEWRLGYRSEPDVDEYSALAAWHIEALRELRCAASRALRRRLQAPTSPATETE